MIEKPSEYKIEGLQDNIDNLYLDSNNVKNTWRILSILSWILFLSCLLNSEIIVNNPSYINIIYSRNFFDLMPVYIYPHFLYLIIYFIGFYYYLVYTIYKKNNNVENALFDGIAKFHFLPLFGVSSLYISSESLLYLNNYIRKDDLEYLISNCVLALFTLVLMIIIYAKTKFNNCEWYFSFFIKKGVYSSIIILSWDNILTNINCFIKDSKVYINIIFPIIKGLFPLIFSLVAKDIIVLFINLVFYLKMIQYYLRCKYNYYSDYKYDENNFLGTAFWIITLAMTGLTILCSIVLISRLGATMFNS